MIRLLFFSLLFCAAAFASDLTVTVQSPSGDRVSGVQIQLFRGADSAGFATQTTIGDGTVQFQNVPDGEYRVVILAPGFAEQSQQVTLPQTQTLTVAAQTHHHAADRRRLRQLDALDGRSKAAHRSACWTAINSSC